MEEIMHEIAVEAIRQNYASILPLGFKIRKIVKYDPQTHTAPNLLFEADRNPAVRYLAFLQSNTSSVPALGETMTGAVDAALAKIAVRQ